jgi:FtsZ-interacting cell division protein ZipA
MTMFMSIPRCTEPSRSFGEMVSVAEYLASELNGSLADPDSGRLSPAHLALIQRQVNGVGESMKRLGVTPGGEEALRLF